MKVTLSGYNIDVLNDKVKTPETISAAYARISRSEKSLLELRKEAIDDVEKARESNSRIVFDMGHSSIAEHAVFNFDIEDISRLAVEELESHRLISVTEKSQRYVKFDDNYYIPGDLSSSKDELEYHKYCTSLFNLYQRIIDENKDNPKIYEDARYILPLSTYTQLGLTVNARELEYIIQCLNSSEFTECKELAQKLYEEVKDIAPSLIRYVDPKTKKQTKLDNLFSIDDMSIITDLKVNLVLGDMLPILNTVEFNLEILKSLEPWESLPREYEFSYFLFILKCSSCAYGQLKRHRMMSLLAERPKVDYPKSIIPPSIANYTDSIIRSQFLLPQKNSLFNSNCSPYRLRNQHEYTIAAKLNFRELVHIARLRLDGHAQWEIRNLVKEMCQKVEELYPWTAMFLCGKDKFQQTKSYFVSKYLE